ncbi:NCS2 family permease [Inconstantimicrobium mannanitabidum]|uniref:Adenine permease n=1 Tax=Inconstantimicrobium mannanitabidum TaxID=1604901 RepID=A0ACB5RAN1_9CLOT|nr:NCS2 family permease [Clostridium sp. TW13]GKX66248.1 adenine permease [Clostridium sp. TW13]
MKNAGYKENFLSRFGDKDVDFRREIRAGITTFLAMAYIIAVNPATLGATGMNQNALVTATCLVSGLATILMGLYANLPFGLAPGMGLNAYFAYTVCGTMGISWQVALAAVFVEGIVFILLSLFKVREAVVQAIPLNLKYAVTAGIGMFIAFIGFVDSGVVIKNEATFVGMGAFTTPKVAVAAVGLFLIVVLEKKKVKGSILWGIIGATIVAWGYAFINPASAEFFGISMPKGVVAFAPLSPIAGKLDLGYMMNSKNLLTFIGIVFTFLFVDFFDTVGTLVGVASRANMLKEDGSVPNVGKALMTDAIATTAAGLVGVSAIATYVESAAGVEEGGRTGFTAIVTGVLFLLAMFFSPLFVAIPTCATAPALIYVGYLMLESVKNIDFSDITEALPAFLIIALMPLTYSIGDGLTVGILSYVIINLIVNFTVKDKAKKKKISIVMLVLAVIFILKLFLPAIMKLF